QDDVDTFVDERREVIDLRLLVEVRSRCVLQVVTGIFGERVLDVLLVSLTPAALGADCDEADCDDLVAASVAAAVVAAATRQAEGERTGAGQTDDAEQSL